MFCVCFVAFIFFTNFSFILTQEIDSEQCSCCDSCPKTQGEFCGGGRARPYVCNQEGLICYAPDSVFDGIGVCIRYQPPERCNDYFQANCTGETCEGPFLCLDQPPAPECSCCPTCLE